MEDTEAFCAKIINEKWDLRPHERDDLLAYLVATAWELSLRYQHGDRKHGSRFCVYAGTILR